MRPAIPGLLHDHVDGSAAVADVIEDLYRLAGKPFPFASLAAWLEFFRDPYADLVGKFSTVTGVLQTAEALERLAYAYGARRAVEGYLYVEGKFAPQYHVFGGLTQRQVVEAVRRGCARAERELNIRILPVVCIGRECSPDEGLAIARLALDYDGEVALDLVCDEANHPPEKHLPAFRLTKGTRVKRECHAGEWVLPDPAATYGQRLLENVRTAVRVLEVDGLGHAIPLVEDDELVREVADRGIRVTGCPASYVQTGLVRDACLLGIDELIDAGVRYTVNPDDDLFLPAMSEVVRVCNEAYGFGPGTWRRLADNVWDSAFASDARAAADC